MVKKSRTFVSMSKIEDIPGEYANPTIADAQLVINPSYKPNQAFQTREIAQSSLDPERLAPGLATDDYSYSLELRGSGKVNDIDSGELPDVADMPRFMLNMQACGFRVLNSHKLKLTGLVDDDLQPGSLIYGAVSGGAGRLLRLPTEGEAFLLLELTSHNAFLGGEDLCLDSPTGDVIGTCVTGLTTKLCGPFGWYARPISNSLQRMRIDDDSPFEFLRQGYGDTVKVVIPHTFLTILAGTELTGGTSGAKLRVIENCPGRLRLEVTAGLGASVGNNVNVTSSTGSAMTIGGQSAGATWINVYPEVGSDAFAAGQVLSWSGVSGTPTLKANAYDAGLLQVITCQVISGVIRGNETLLGTGALVAPTISWVETELVLEAATGGIVAFGTAVTGAISGATGTLHAAATNTSEYLTIRRTSAAPFEVGETLTGTGLGTAPTVEEVHYTMNRFPRTGITLTGATSGAKATIVDPNQSDGYGVFASQLHTVSNPGSSEDPTDGTAFYPRVRGTQSYIYYEPAEGQFVPGEDLINTATGDTVTATAPEEVFEIVVWQGKTISHDFNRDGYERSMVGARGSARITGTAGETVTTEFRWNGRHHSQQDQDIGIEVAPSGLPDYGDEPTPIRLAEFEVGMPSCVGDVSIDFAITNANRKCASAPDGIEQSEVVGRLPIMEMTPETVGVGVRDFLQEMRDANELEDENVRYLQSPTAEGNTFTFCAPNSQITDLSDEDRDGIAVTRVRWQLNRSSIFGNDHCWLLMD